MSVVTSRAETLVALLTLTGAVLVAVVVAAVILVIAQGGRPPRLVVGARPRLIQPPLALGPGSVATRSHHATGPTQGSAGTADDPSASALLPRPDPTAMLRSRIAALTQRVDELNRQLDAQPPT